MNDAELKRLIDTFVKIEKRHATQSMLERLRNHLRDLVNSPQDAQTQSNVNSSLIELREGLRELQVELTPRATEKLTHFTGFQHFSETLVDRIDSMISRNAMTPQVASDLVEKESEERAEVIANLKSLSKELEFFSVDFNLLPEGEAEIGFEVPRDIFDNELHGFIGELRDLERYVRIISLVETGEVSKTRLGPISTTDPLILLGLPVAIVVALGKCVTWGLDTWERVERIRKLRLDAQISEEFSDKEIEFFFNNKIEESIKSAIDQKISILLSQSAVPDKEEAELGNQLGWFLESLLAKIERGMTVELRLPPPEESDEGDQEDSGQDKEFLDLQSRLVFRRIEGTPVLKLPKPPKD